MSAPVPGSPPGPPARPPSINAGLVVLGLLCGVVSATTAVLMSIQAQVPVIAATVLLPVVTGIVVLLVPSWRRAASGFLMGLAIGWIIFGGLCAGTLALLASMGPH